MSPFTRGNGLIVLLALASAGFGLVISQWLRPPALPTASVATTPMLKIGDRRADLTLPTLDGSSRSLSTWDGKLLLLNFWASWCGPCREEMPLLDRTRKKLTGRGVEVVGIASDNAADASAFLRGHPVSYPILIDDPLRATRDRPDASQLFGNSRNVLPYSVLIGRDGRIVAERFGGFSDESLQQWLAPFL